MYRHRYVCKYVPTYICICLFLKAYVHVYVYTYLCNICISFMYNFVSAEQKATRFLVQCKYSVALREFGYIYCWLNVKRHHYSITTEYINDVFTLNKNIDKFNLPHIWDRSLLNTPGLTLKIHVPAVENANSSQPNILTQLNQSNIPTQLGQPNSPMQIFTGSEHAHGTYWNPYKVQHFSFPRPEEVQLLAGWKLSSTTNVLFQRRI